jgi:hypothetical protein
VSGLPPVPAVLPVQRGTDLTVEEIEFLTSKGIDFEGQPAVRRESPHTSSLRIDLKSYPEKIDLGNLTQHLLSQNGKNIWQRSFITGKHLKRIERTEKQVMRVISEQTVSNGNAFGKHFRIWSHKNGDKLLRGDYWVQICCFPTCTCEDYFQHHGFRSSFLLCKHLYWVFKNIFRLDIQTNLLIIQPVLTVAELEGMLARQTNMA